MWISRAHYQLISEKAREFRVWHEERVKQLYDGFQERLAERDSIIARQETQLRALDEERKTLTAELIARLTERFRPVSQDAAIDPEMPDWMKAIKDQVDEVKGDGGK